MHSRHGKVDSPTVIKEDSELHPGTTEKNKRGVNHGSTPGDVT